MHKGQALDSFPSNTLASQPHRKDKKKKKETRSRREAVGRQVPKGKAIAYPTLHQANTRDRLCRFHCAGKRLRVDTRNCEENRVSLRTLIAESWCCSAPPPSSAAGTRLHGDSDSIRPRWLSAASAQHCSHGSPKVERAGDAAQCRRGTRSAGASTTPPGSRPCRLSAPSPCQLPSHHTRGDERGTTTTTRERRKEYSAASQVHTQTEQVRLGSCDSLTWAHEWLTAS